MTSKAKHFASCTKKVTNVLLKLSRIVYQKILGDSSLKITFRNRVARNVKREIDKQNAVQGKSLDSRRKANVLQILKFTA